MNGNLIGTQTPVRRILDPDEAIAALESVVPGLFDHRRPQPAELDWALIENGLGTSLPADFKRLAEIYPSFTLDDFLLVSLPEPGEEVRRLRGMRDGRAWWDSDDATRQRIPYPAPGGLLPWGESNEGDRFLWSSVESRPQQWRVTICLSERWLVALRRRSRPVPGRTLRRDPRTMGTPPAQP